MHGGLASPVFCTLKSKGSLWGEQLWSSIQGLVRCRPPADVALRVHWWVTIGEPAVASLQASGNFGSPDLFGKAAAWL